MFAIEGQVKEIVTLVMSVDSCCRNTSVHPIAYTESRRCSNSYSMIIVEIGLLHNDCQEVGSLIRQLHRIVGLELCKCHQCMATFDCPHQVGLVCRVRLEMRISPYLHIGRGIVNAAHS